tara:strand:+ start:466 stop:738 length:273 start_codon:yes stop_codon:yes gene_type:complete
MSGKVSQIIIKYLSDGPKMRYEVTNKIKNYPKPEREAGIKSVMKRELVSLYELVDSPLGRKPVMIKLTAKGVKEAMSLSESPNDKTIWAV